MIKKFNEYINEDYFSKLASRKDSGNVRKENRITEQDVLSIFDNKFIAPESIIIRKDCGQTIIDIDGSFHLGPDVEEIPFQFGTITGDFDCTYCEKLKSLEGCPREVGGNFYCVMCCRQFSYDEIASLCEVKGKIIV